MTATGKISLEQLAKDITACKKAIEAALPTIAEAELFINEVNEPLETELIQGYTAENWQEIIDGGYLCEFSVGENFECSFYGLLETFFYPPQPTICFISNVNINRYNHCRPAQIKGVMRPIFVIPEDASVMCTFFDKGYQIHEKRSRASYGAYVHGSYQDATSYIEL